MKNFYRSARTLVLAVYLLGFSLHEGFAQTNRGGSVPLEQLPQELRDLSPRDHFIPCSEKKVGVIHALEGKIIVIHVATEEAYFGMAGDPVHEKDTLITLSQSKCRIRFVDEDVVTMASGTEFSVESFEDQREEGRKSSLFRMLKGRAMFYAMRLFRYKDTRFAVATPTNTIGVRGTKFGAHVYYLNEGTADRGVRVADGRNEISPYLAQADPGRSFTDCFSEDGVLDVDGRAVPPGQMFNGRTGQVIPTPPDVIRSFQQATEIRTEGAKGEAPPTGEAPKTEGETSQSRPPMAVTGTAPAIADIQANITTVVQVQTGQKTENPPDPAPPRDIGYFAAMLTNYTGSFLQDVFVQFEDHRRYDIDTATGKGLYDDSWSIEGRPNFGAEPLLSHIYLGTAGDSGDLGATRPISHASLGSNSYMDWGYWTMSTPVNAGADQYYINNKAYYVLGQATENLDRLKNLGEVAYSGSAWGTYWAAAGGTDLSGAFSTKVNLNNGAVSEFTMELKDTLGGTKAKILNASGTVYGYANPGNNNCGHFDINPASGTWALNNSSANLKNAAQGALYGPNAEHIGGVWGMYRDSTEGAAGVFQGSR